MLTTHASTAQTLTVDQAYDYCSDVTRRSGSSFSVAFWMLPKPKRRALHAIYSFCRLADDIADDPEIRGDRHALLERWRAELDDAYRGRARHPIGMALGDTIERFRLPEPVFRELLDGIEFDLQHKPVECFEDLRFYCYRVASTVGILLVHVMGFRNPQALEYAETLGIAVQLTNVLRDIGDDAGSGRIYLPRDELERFGVAAESLAGSEMTDELRLMLGYYAERARLYFERADRLLPPEDRRSLRAAEAMGRIYRTLLEELQRKSFPCLDEPLRLAKSRRLAIAAGTWLGVERT